MGEEWLADNQHLAAQRGKETAAWLAAHEHMGEEWLAEHEHLAAEWFLDYEHSVIQWLSDEGHLLLGYEHQAAQWLSEEGKLTAQWLAAHEKVAAHWADEGEAKLERLVVAIAHLLWMYLSHALVRARAWEGTVPVLIIAIAVCALGVINRSLADSAIAQEEEAAARRRAQAAKETRELVSTNGNLTFAAFEALCRNRGLQELSRESLRAAFDEADADKSDTIDKAEVEKLIATLQSVHAAARSRRVQAAKETRELVSTNGNITFAAFEALCRNRGLTEHSREAMRAAFDEADADKSDTIDKAEVEKLIAGMLRVEAPPPAPSSPLAPFSPSSPGAHTVMSLTRFSQTVARSPQPSLTDSPSAPAPPSRAGSSVRRSGSGRLSLN